MVEQDQKKTKTPIPEAFRGTLAGVDVGVKKVELKKMDADGNVFEILEGGDGRPTVCTKRVPGMAPDESYAKHIPMKEEESNNASN